jgi:cellulose synthase/poly-beta-1,6-N-acetylglucosamine synthase-like glycosyltransferase
MAKFFFVAALALLAHTYLLYPFLLFLWDGLGQVASNLAYLRKGEERRRTEGTTCPRVSIVVAAYNEEECIARKIENCLALDYPADKLEVLIGSDGSSDGTDEVVRAYQAKDARVRLLAAPRGGKSSVLNRVIPLAQGELVLLSDANTLLDSNALKRLVRPFADPSVGAVCGKLQLYNRTNQDFEESAYWTYESLIKLYEGKHGLVMGANGGLYAIRRVLFTALPMGTIVDDFVIPLRLLAAGHKVTYEPAAVAFEETTEDYGAEFKRRVRIAAGNFQSLAVVPGLLSPTRGARAFAFWSHKLLRWCAPGLMAVAFAANLWLAREPLFRALMAAQLAFYLLAVVGRARMGRGWFGRLASVAYYFVTMNWALTVGFWRYVRQAQTAAWDRTARKAGAVGR